MELEALAGPLGTLVLGGAVIKWLLADRKEQMNALRKEVNSLQAKLDEANEQRRADWRAQAEMNLTNQRALDKSTQALERLAGKKLSPPPSSGGYHIRNPDSST